MSEFKNDFFRDPLIRAVWNDGSESQVSLLEALERANDIKAIVGESETQAFAMQRILFALVIEMIYTRELNGDLAGSKDKKELIHKWKQLWREKKFPEGLFQKLLEEENTSFRILGDGPRFMQAKEAELRNGTFYTPSKLVGICAESSNKPRLFQQSSGDEKELLDPQTAASWLPHLIGYDDTSSKKTSAYKKSVPKEKQLSVGTGWLGKIGAIYCVGSNLFETLMLNAVLLNRNGDPWESAVPFWKKDVEVIERDKSSKPNDLVELLTTPSRYVWLSQTEEGMVDGVYLMGGRIFDPVNMNTEVFTVWKKADPTGKAFDYKPKRHSGDRQMWRDFQSIIPVSVEEPVQRPGIILWLEFLQSEEINALDEDQIIELRAPYAVYGDKDFFITDLSGQQMVLFSRLLTEAGEFWKESILSEIDKIDQLARAAGFFAKDIFLASGGREYSAKTAYSSGREEIYSRVTAPFTAWLSTLNPGNSQIENSLNQWTEEAREIALAFKREAVYLAPSSAWMGRMVEASSTTGDKKKTGSDKKESGGTRLAAIPLAEMAFDCSVRKLYPKPVAEEEREEDDEE